MALHAVSRKGEKPFTINRNQLFLCHFPPFLFFVLWKFNYVLMYLSSGMETRVHSCRNELDPLPNIIQSVLWSVFNSSPPSTFTLSDDNRFSIFFPSPLSSPSLSSYRLDRSATSAMDPLDSREQRACDQGREHDSGNKRRRHVSFHRLPVCPSLLHHHQVTLSFLV
jgi:hypothetical protein